MKSNLQTWLVLLTVALLIGVTLMAPVPSAVAYPPQQTNFGTIQTDDGSVSAPAWGFTSDTDTGIYRVGTNNLGVAAGGTLVMDWNGTSTDANSLPIVNIGAAGTDFSATGGLTLADALVVSSGGITGTINTAAQPNITSLGTLATATITDLTSTNLTGTVQTANQPSITNLGTQTYFTTTNAISMLGATFTGPTKYGVALNYQSGASITHGFALTPTVCLLFPAEITATLTITETGFSSDTATHSNPMYWMCGR